MSAPSLKLHLPPRSLFTWPPDPYPIAIPPPRDARTFASPFPIDADTFNAVLDWRVPVTIGSLYATTAIIMNKINRDRKNVPWGFSKTKSFHYFVLAHNIFLAVFSAFTFIGMIRALAHTWPGRRDLPFLGKLWPGLRTENGLAGAADALCKLHGPDGFGNSVFYSTPTHSWTSTSGVKLGGDHLPDTANVGRLWNEGLAFWGWWFYLSKFYEVLDTFIILAKGKRSSTLQTYHHTGAMACMWAGIRYMSPPIWMFCFINSGIHALMYTYYTLSALRIRVPQGIKRTLTTMQITQFLVGITFATLHLFVSYSVPVSKSYTVNSVVSAAASAVSSAASAAASKAPEVAAAAAPGFGAMLQKVLLRAVGEEGMAKNVETPSAASQAASIPTPKANLTQTLKSETKYRTQYEYVPCINTEGQAFAIWLNVFYLAPLTLLFVRFFIRSYTRRGAPNTKHSKPGARLQKAAEDAAHGANKELEHIGKAAENGVGNVINRFGNNSTPKKGKKPADSEKHEQYEATPEKVSTPEQPESTKSNKSNSNSIKVSQIRKRASAEHNKLRQMFEDGPQAFGRSVDTSTKQNSFKTKTPETEHPANLSPCAEDDESTKDRLRSLEKEAEEKVEGAREAAGGQASRGIETMGSLGQKAMENMKELQTTSSDLLDDLVTKVKETASAPSAPEKQDQITTDAENTTESNDDGKLEDDTKEADQKSEEEELQTDQDDPLLVKSTSSSSTDSNRPQTPPPLLESKPDLSAPVDRSRSSSPKRSSSPSKGNKSRIPQPKNKNLTSPAKKILTPATTTISMAAHSHPVTTVNQENGSASTPSRTGQARRSTSRAITMLEQFGGVSEG